MKNRVLALLVTVSLLASVAAGMPLHFPGEMDGGMESCPMTSRGAARTDASGTVAVTTMTADQAAGDDKTSPDDDSVIRIGAKDSDQTNSDGASHCARMRRDDASARGNTKAAPAETNAASAAGETAADTTSEETSPVTTESPRQLDLGRLCCALNCTSPPPVSSVASYSFAPVTTSVEDSVARQIWRLFSRQPRFSAPVVKTFDGFVETYVSPPKYLSNSSFLI